MAWYSYSMVASSVLATSTGAAVGGILFQLKSAGVSFEILRVELGTSNNTAQEGVPIRIFRQQSGAADVQPYTPVRLDSTNSPASAMVASSSGTGTLVGTSNFGGLDVRIYDTQSIGVAPVLYLPVPEERWTFRAGDIVAVRIVAASTFDAYEGTITWREWH